jgi:hypothetical protein
MRYVTAAALGLLVALTAGAIAGVREYLMLAGSPDAGVRARVCAESIAVALNCAGLFALLCVPIAVAAQVVRSRRSAR